MTVLKNDLFAVVKTDCYVICKYSLENPAVAEPTYFKLSDSFAPSDIVADSKKQILYLGGRLRSSSTPGYIYHISVNKDWLRKGTSAYVDETYHDSYTDYDWNLGQYAGARNRSNRSSVIQDFCIPDSSIKKWNVNKGIPVAISLTSKQHILITIDCLSGSNTACANMYGSSFESEWGTFLIAEFTSEGKMLKEIYLQQDICHAVELSCGLYAVCSHSIEVSLISIIDSNGKVVADSSACQQLKKYHTSNLSMRLAKDQMGNLIVADPNVEQLLYIFSPEAQHLGCVNIANMTRDSRNRGYNQGGYACNQGGYGSNQGGYACNRRQRPMQSNKLYIQPIFCWNEAKKSLVATWNDGLLSKLAISQGKSA